jgi:hypothetical protein
MFGFLACALAIVFAVSSAVASVVLPDEVETSVVEGGAGMFAGTARMSLLVWALASAENAAMATTHAKRAKGIDRLNDFILNLQKLLIQAERQCSNKTGQSSWPADKKQL